MQMKYNERMFLLDERMGIKMDINSKEYKEYRISVLKNCIEREQTKTNKEKRQGITVNIQSRQSAIDKMQKEIDELLTK